jgi:hypothetical protein
LKCFTDEELRRGLRDLIARVTTALARGDDPRLIAEVLAVFVEAARDDQRQASTAPRTTPDGDSHDP